MKQFLIDREIDFDSIINMDETSIFLDFPSKLYEWKKSNRIEILNFQKSG